MAQVIGKVTLCSKNLKVYKIDDAAHWGYDLMNEAIWVVLAPELYGTVDYSATIKLTAQHIPFPPPAMGLSKILKPLFTFPYKEKGNLYTVSVYQKYTTNVRVWYETATGPLLNGNFLMNIIRGILSAVDQLHKAGLYHGNLSMEKFVLNIKGDEVEVLIRDIRNEGTDSVEGKKDDFKALGRMFNLMLGKNPPGDLAKQRRYNNSDLNHTLKNLEKKREEQLKFIVRNFSLPYHSNRLLGLLTSRSMLSPEEKTLHMLSTFTLSLIKHVDVGSFLTGHYHDGNRRGRKWTQIVESLQPPYSSEFKEALNYHIYKRWRDLKPLVASYVASPWDYNQFINEVKLDYGVDMRNWTVNDEVSGWLSRNPNGTDTLIWVPEGTPLHQRCDYNDDAGSFFKYCRNRAAHWKATDGSVLKTKVQILMDIWPGFPDVVHRLLYENGCDLNIQIR